MMDFHKLAVELASVTTLLFGDIDPGTAFDESP